MNGWRTGDVLTFYNDQCKKGLERAAALLPEDTPEARD